MNPCIGAVHSHIDRNVADNLYSSFICVVLEPVPLLKKLELKELPEIDVICKFICIQLDSSGLSESNIVFPQLPFTVVEVEFESHKKTVIIKPEHVVLAELSELRQRFVVAAVKCLAKNGKS